jgi:phage baseplate assembly protein V
MIDQLRRFVAPIHQRITSMISRGTVASSDDTKKMQEIQARLMANETLDGLERFQNYGLTSRPHDGAELLSVFVGGSRDHGIVIAVDDRRYRLKLLEKGEVALYDDQGQSIHLKRGNEIVVTTPGKLTVNAGEEVQVNAPSIVATTETAELTCSESATVTAPETNVVASTKVALTTPLLEVSGVVTCSGIAAGGASAQAGKVVVQGSLEASGDISSTGNVQDSAGTMAEMRTSYNSHTHPGGAANPPSPQMT